MNTDIKREVIQFLEENYPQYASAIKEEKYDSLKIHDKVVLASAFHSKGWIKLNH